MLNYRDEHDAAYEDENGILTWLAYDKFGNEIYCYWNGYTEFHVKSEPICDCGGELLYLNRGKWVCAKCGRNYNENELDMPYVYGICLMSTVLMIHTPIMMFPIQKILVAIIMPVKGTLPDQ